MPTQIHAGMKKLATVTYQKADGTPGTVTGVPTWASSVPDVLNVVPAADGMSADCIYLSPGDSVVSVTASGMNGVLITVSDTVTCLPAATATGATLTFGPEVPQ